MTSSWLLYLAAATGSQAVFAFFYWLVLARLSTFGWNRAYLLSGLAVSLVLPLVALPAAWARLVWPAPAAGAAWLLPAWHLGAAPPTATPTAAAAATGFTWERLVLTGYWLGVAWQLGRTARSLGWLYRLSRRHPRTRLGQGWLVQLPEPSRPAFSFGKHVFLSPIHAQLSPGEYAQLVQHEQVHGAQYHSLDLLLAEMAGWFFWFNGLVVYLRRELRTVHEYLADAAVTRQAASCTAYGHLLLKLAGGPLPTPLVHPFATKQVARRIQMLTFPPSSPMKKLRFLLVVPITALAWTAAAALGPTPAAAPGSLRQAPAASKPAAQRRISTITWQGNTYLSDAQLNEALGLKPGDIYDENILQAKIMPRLNSNGNGLDITSRYMDNGYLFFQLEPVAKAQPNGTTNLLFSLHEGPTARLSTLTLLVLGKRRNVSADEALKLTALHNGELFSRAKLMQAQRNLAASGLFVPDKIRINPQPNPAAGLVNIEFVVVEK